MPSSPLRAYATIVAGLRRPLPSLTESDGYVIVAEDVEFEGRRRARYARLIGAGSHEALPAWPHVVATSMHTALVADPRFALRPLGLVHVSQTVEVLGRLPARGRVEVELLGYAPHRRGVLCRIETRCCDASRVVWKGQTTALAPGVKWPGGPTPSKRPARRATPTRVPDCTTTESLPGGLGRAYSVVSWDWNPIHLHSLTARPFGFARPIVHGMWTAARCLTLLGGEARPAYEIRFRRPLPLPRRVRFEAWASEGVARAVSPEGDEVYVTLARL